MVPTSSQVTRNGKTIGKPKIAMIIGQTGRVEMGEQSGGAFTGVRFDTTVSRAQTPTARLAPFRQTVTETPALGGIGFLPQQTGDGC